MQADQRFMHFSAIMFCSVHGFSTNVLAALD
jgi:hypothetical protein